MGAQTQSPLFRLPPEIRAEILRLVVYDGAASQHVAHFEGSGGARGFVRAPCRPVPDADISYRNPVEWYSLNNSAWRGGHLACYSALRSRRATARKAEGDDGLGSGQAGDRDKDRGHRVIGEPLASPVPLLLACRRLHDEAADVLYESLSFIGLKPLRRFLRDIGGDGGKGRDGRRRANSYLARVRTVDVQWEGIMRCSYPTAAPATNPDFADWAPTCERLVASLPRLRRLRARVIVCARTSPRVAELFTRPLLQAVEKRNRDKAARANGGGGYGDDDGDSAVEAAAEVVRNCWDPHSDPAKKRVVAVTLDGCEVPIRVCHVSPQNMRLPADRVWGRLRRLDLGFPG